MNKIKAFYVFRGLSSWTALASDKEEKQGIRLLVMFSAEADLLSLRRKATRNILYQL